MRQTSSGPEARSLPVFVGIGLRVMPRVGDASRKAWELEAFDRLIALKDTFDSGW
jgi:hypothetical protein